jgi:hypothetical protein
VALGRLATVLPASVTRALAELNTKGVRMHDSIPVKEYDLTAPSQD